MWSSLWILLQFALSVELSATAAAPRSFCWLNCPWGRKASCPPPDPKLNYRPVIGIFSHPGDRASGLLNNATNASYIAASFVKFVESGGARVTPLIYNEPSQILQKDTCIFWYMLDVVRRNDGGDRVPLLAVCLGFELLAIIAGKDKGILEVFNAKDEASKLQFMKNTSIQGTVFERFPPSLLKKLATECLTMENHNYGISPEKFQKNGYLYSFFKIVTTSICKDNKAQEYPMTAFQWHLEKNAFEWGLPGIPRSEAAVQVTQNVAHYFVR